MKRALAFTALQDDVPATGFTGSDSVKWADLGCSTVRSWPFLQYYVRIRPVKLRKKPT